MLASLGESDETKHTSCLDSVMRLMMMGGGRLTVARGRKKERLGHGPTIVLPFEPESTIEPGTLSTQCSNGGGK